MISTATDLIKSLSGTILEGTKILSLPIPQSHDVAFAISIPKDQWYDYWQAAHRLIEKTGRWPITHTTFGERDLQNADPFSRFYFEEAPQFNGHAESTSPSSILKRSNIISEKNILMTFLKEYKEKVAEEEISIHSYINDFHDELINRAGVPPKEEILKAQQLYSFNNQIEIEQWLDRWEQSQHYQNNPEIYPWYTPEEDHFLIFLPILNGFDSLAYIHWYGSSYMGSEYFIALFKLWSKKWGVKLISNHGTILNCLVDRPPKTIDEAWPIAIEHMIMSNCSTGYIHAQSNSLRDYAHMLINNTHWVFEERP